MLLNMKLIGISLISLLFVGFILLTARIWGQSQVYPPYEHLLLQEGPPVIAAPVQTPEELDELIQMAPQAWAILPVRISADKKIFILDPSQDSSFLDSMLEKQKAQPNQQILKGNKLNTYNFEELQAHYLTLVPLSQYYQKYPQQVFALNLIDNISEFHAYLKQDLANTSAEDRTVILSDTHVLLSATKEQLPELVYGSSMADLTRLLSMESLGIITAVPLKADILTAPLFFRIRPVLKSEVVQEVKRRNKKVFVTEISADQLELAKGLDADGYFMKSLEDLRKSLEQFSAL